ncbi:hypothetical protein [Sulfurovum sp. TSL6]|uniref:hypothetical protein n=1 Tax=Sulfurovum sp. TSL6 TaxID=2826995 RepID=UPI001CC4C4D5|nr:hypothetical protein [Sulfurovum sp. TSL6]
MMIPSSVDIQLAVYFEVKWFFAISAGYFFYVLRLKNILDDDLLQKIVIILIFGGMFTLLTEQVLKDSYVIQSNHGYSLLFLIPLILIAFQSTPKKKIIYFLILGLFIIIALKRGAIIIFAVIFLLIFLPQIIKSKSLSLKLLFIIMLILITGILIVNANIINDLLMRAEDTSGSGRDMLFALFLEKIFNRSSIEIIFGSGPISAIAYSGTVLGTRHGATYGLLPHSDGLLVLFEYGFIGLFMYMYIMVKLFSLAKNKFTIYKHAVISILIIYLFVAIYSHVFFNDSSWKLLAALGIVSADLKLYKQILLNDKKLK